MIDGSLTNKGRQATRAVIVSGGLFSRLSRPPLSRCYTFTLLQKITPDHRLILLLLLFFFFFFAFSQPSLMSFENAIFMNSVSDTGNNPSYLLLKSMVSKRITFQSQFCLTFF